MWVTWALIIVGVLLATVPRFEGLQANPKKKPGRLVGVGEERLAVRIHYCLCIGKRLKSTTVLGCMVLAVTAQTLHASSACESVKQSSGELCAFWHVQWCLGLCCGVLGYAAVCWGLVYI